MKSRMIVFLALVVFLAYGSNLRAQDIGPNSIPDGEYWLTLRAKIKGVGKTVESRTPVTAVTKDGVVTLTNEQQKEFPIFGTIEKGVFTAKLNDAGGVIHFYGRLKKGVIKGAIDGASNDKKETMQGTFTISRKEPEKPET